MVEVLDLVQRAQFGEQLLVQHEFVHPDILDLLESLQVGRLLLFLLILTLQIQLLTLHLAVLLFLQQL